MAVIKTTFDSEIEILRRRKVLDAMRQSDIIHRGVLEMEGKL